MDTLLAVLTLTISWKHSNYYFLVFCQLAIKLLFDEFLSLILVFNILVKKKKRNHVNYVVIIYYYSQSFITWMLQHFYSFGKNVFLSLFLLKLIIPFLYIDYLMLHFFKKCVNLVLPTNYAYDGVKCNFLAYSLQSHTNLHEKCQ